MKINSLNIKNYKSFLDSGDIDVDNNIFALIGQNNAGKSTVLDAIQCFFPDCRKSIDDKDFHKNTTQDVKIVIQFCDIDDEYIENKLFHELRIKAENKIKELRSKERIDEDKINKEQEKFEIQYNEKLQELKEKYHINDQKVSIILIRPKNGNKKYYFEDDTILSEADLKKILPGLKVIPAIRDPKTESTAGTNSYLKELIQMLDDSMETSITVNNTTIPYNEINTIICEESNNRCEKLSKEITNIYTNIIGSDRFMLQVKSEVNIARGTSYFTTLLDRDTNISNDILNCGTGYQSMIILALLETYVKLSNKDKAYILIIEEPEVYLHPTLQRKMIETLIRISEFNQVLFSTHSPITISKLSRKQIKMVVKDNGMAQIREINIEKVIDELGIRPDIIFEKNGVIFVEGPDDKKCIEALLNKINLDYKKYIDVIIAGNCENLKFYANAEIILKGKRDFPFLICRDADSKGKENQKQALKKEILDINKERLHKCDEILDKNIIIIGEYSLESIFLYEYYFRGIIDANTDKINNAINTYNKVFQYYREKRIDENTFAKFYQPKLFFEKKLDKYGYEESEARSIWDESYKNKWKKAVVEENMDLSKEDIDNYLEIREKINRYTANCMKERINYMEEWIKRTEINDLEKFGFQELICVFKEFIDRVFSV